MARISDSGNPGLDPKPVLAPQLRAAPGTSLYVHVPYCVAKCTYCDFYSLVPEKQEDPSIVVGNILREANSRAPKDPKTLFSGGGTPTMLTEDDLARLLAGLEKATGFRSSAREVTVECNPESLDAAKAKRMLDGGVGRLSIGFQSLEPAILQLFGRVHSPEQSFEAFHAARQAGFHNLSIDLIYGVPGQDLARWRDDLLRVIALRPEHISAYSLAFEEGTVLTHELAAKRIERLPEELDLEFFLSTRELLKEHGYEPYEVSNFSTKTHQCAHNEMYWRNGHYVGIGPGAVSYLGQTRFGNPRSVGLWARGIQDAGFGATWEETLDPVAKLLETWWLGLRTAEGVHPGRARKWAGLTPGQPDPALELAQALAKDELLVNREGAWSMTPKGLPLADAISRRFLAAHP